MIIRVSSKRRYWEALLADSVGDFSQVGIWITPPSPIVRLASPLQHFRRSRRSFIGDCGTEQSGSGSLRGPPGRSLFGLYHFSQSPVVREGPILAGQNVPSPSRGLREQSGAGLLPLG